MMNNTLMEAILLSRALCHSGCPEPEGEYPAEPEPLTAAANPGSGKGPAAIPALVDAAAARRGFYTDFTGV